MQIYSKIDDVLSSLSVPYYDSFVDSADGAYIVYTLYDTPSLSGDGRVLCIDYVVTLNIFGKKVSDVDKLQHKLLCVMQDSGFCYAGCTYSIDTDFENTYRRAIDFKIALISESEE